MEFHHERNNLASFTTSVEVSLRIHFLNLLSNEKRKEQANYRIHVLWVNMIYIYKDVLSVLRVPYHYLVKTKEYKDNLRSKAACRHHRIDS